mgnify:CR=1 FL=1
MLDALTLFPPPEAARAIDTRPMIVDSIHGPGAWAANPWVCAITFTNHRCNIDQMEADHG